MAKFSDLPPEIAEQIVEWVDLQSQNRLYEENIARMQLAMQAEGFLPENLDALPNANAPVRGRAGRRPQQNNATHNRPNAANNGIAPHGPRAQANNGGGTAARNRPAANTTENRSSNTAAANNANINAGSNANANVNANNGTNNANGQNNRNPNTTQPDPNETDVNTVFGEGFWEHLFRAMTGLPNDINQPAAPTPVPANTNATSRTGNNRSSTMSPATRSANASAINARASARNARMADGSDEEMPALEPIQSVETSGTRTAVSDDDMPPLEEIPEADATPTPMSTAAASSHSDTPTNRQREPAPTFFGLRSGFLRSAVPAIPPTTVPVPLETANPAAPHRSSNVGFYGDRNHNPFAGMFSRPNSTPANVGLNAVAPSPVRNDPAPALASSSGQNGNTRTHAPEDLEDMPALADLNNPVAEASDLGGTDTDTDTETDDNEEEEVEGDEDDWETDESENSFTGMQMPDYRVDPSSWSYPDGLPSDCLLPLALVSKAFLYAARKSLYGGQELFIHGPWQLSLIVRTLTNPQVSPFVRMSSTEDSDAASEKRFFINDLIRGFHFHIHGSHQNTVSLGRGGVGLIVEALKACPKISSLDMRVDCLRSAWKPLYDAMTGLAGLEELHMQSGTDEVYPLVLSIDRLAQFAQFWPKMKRLDLFMLGANREMGRIQPFNQFKLTSLALTGPTINSQDLEALLAGSTDTLESLTLTNVPNTMTRGALASILLKHTSTLKMLDLLVSSDWQPRPSDTPASSSPEISAFFLNTIVGKFKKLKTLKWQGPLANAGIFISLPGAVETVAWSNCPAIHPGRVARNLANLSPSGRRRAPRLRCLTVEEDDTEWTSQDTTALRTQLQLRGACFHTSQSSGMFGGIGMGIPLNIAGANGVAFPIAI